MSTNRLAEETSPYLLLHKDNPVDWYPWGEQALAEAEATGKPILLSIGYAACHWCHTMNAESFSDPQTAAAINENFVAIKVDRTERPDLDQYFQTAAQAMGHRGGWPLTVFLTPKGQPFFVGGYFPKSDRDGLPGFANVLEQVSKIFQTEGETAAANAEKISAALGEQWARDTRGKIDPRTLDILSVHTAQRFDIFYGGLTGTPKFPHVPQIEVLWRAFLRTGAAPFAQLTATTLDAICLSSVYDHVGGGFHRYSVDERWLIPHFEKMLAENAQLVDMLSLVGQFNRHPLYRTRIEETLSWIKRDLSVDGAFAVGLDADTDGAEGAYYLWTEAEIDAALSGTFAQRFKAVYNVATEGTFAGRNILQRLGAPFPLNDADEALLKRQRELLLAQRAKRTAPLRDDQILADANGLAIRAFANAGAVFSNPDWVQTAMGAFEFVVKVLGENERLYHSWRAGKRGHMGLADDYAQMIRAALALWEVTGRKDYLDHAKAWTRTMNERFWDNALGGYFQSADEDSSVLSRMRTIIDQATPSANATMIDNLIKLFLLTGETFYRERADAVLGAFAGELGGAYLAMGGYLNGLESLMAGLQIVIVGPKESGKTQELVQAVLSRSLPNRLLVRVAPDEILPEGHPAHGKTMENGQPTAYICQHTACLAPITDAATLAQVLQLPARPQAPAGNA